MHKETRTSKSIKNAKVALAFYFVNLILQFFSRKIFLDYLGAEILGLNTTAQNLLGFLNLAELGIGGAIAYTLYKPLFQNDRQTINDIVSVQGWLYRRVALIVLAGAGVLMCFFPWIFAKAQVPLWYTYGSFLVLLVGALLGYFVNYRQIVLTADQKEYKITLNVQGYKALKVVLQILAVRYLKDGYVYWMILELLMSFLTAFVLDRLLRREYPWLRSTPSEGRILRQKYPEIITKTKQIFFHRIGTFTLEQTSPLIIYAYASLTLVSIYGNYLLIVTGVTVLMNALMSSVGAGVGNLVAEGNQRAIKRFFWELTSGRIWVASVISFGIYRLADSFIILWVGEEYVLGNAALTVLTLMTFISLTRTNDIFLSAYGLFQDIWVPVIEAVLNLGLSITLGYFYGLPGILSGALVSLIVIVWVWKPYFLYKCGFKEKIGEYVLRQLRYLLLLGIAWTLSIFLSDWLMENFLITDYWNWLKYAFKITGIYVLASGLIFYAGDKGMYDLMCRVKRFVSK